MKVVSFNVNGIRARQHQLEALIERHDPDVIGLQEIKVADDAFPLDEVSSLGYHVVFHGQKTHYGVALMTKQEPTAVFKGFPGDDEEAQRRMIAVDLPLPDGSTMRVFNGYFPQGESRDHAVKFPAKRKFYADLTAWLREGHAPDQPMLLMGDMNISPTDLDIGIGEDNRKRWLRTGKCSFLPEEREWLQTLLDWGFTDTFRAHYPDVDDLFSWFDYRSRGFERDPKRGLRIDLILATPSLQARLQDAGIDYEIRGMEKPSDHAPVWASFDV